VPLDPDVPDEPDVPEEPDAPVQIISIQITSALANVPLDVRSLAPFNVI
jgi:hypothetical protein